VFVGDAGELQEPSKKAILRVTAAQDALMEGSGDSKVREAPYPSLLSSPLSVRGCVRGDACGNDGGVAVADGRVRRRVVQVSDSKYEI
jgi:hypothetical protein